MSDDRESNLVISIISLNNRIQKQVGSALSAHGIGLTEYLVINQLCMEPTQTMRRSDLADRVGLSPSGITRLLSPMERIGLIEKVTPPRDARVSLVTLTAAGKQIYEDAQVSFKHTSTELFEQLEAKQRDVFSELLKTVAKRF